MLALISSPSDHGAGGGWTAASEITINNTRYPFSCSCHPSRLVIPDRTESPIMVILSLQGPCVMQVISPKGALAVGADASL